MKKKILALFTLTVILAALCCACGKTQPTVTDVPDSTPTPAVIPNDFTGISVEASKFDLQTEAGENAVTIKLSGSSAEITGQGATFANGQVTITAPGSYIISGTLDNGSVHVAIDKKEKAHLILNGANISCSNGPAIFVESADKTVITLAAGTENAVFDGKTYTSGNACIYSKDDLTINGTGTLTVNGSFNNGIGCKNDLHIIGGTINVTATVNGLKGNDSVLVTGGKISITAGKDGIKSDNEDDPAKGFVFISGGEISIVSEDDGIQAVTSLGVIGGSLKITAKDKNLKCKPYLYTAPGVIK